MTLKKIPTLEEALATGKELVAAREKYGRKGMVPRSYEEVQEAFAVVAAAYEKGLIGKKERVDEELATANRRYAALNARYQKLLKRTGEQDELEA